MGAQLHFSAKNPRVGWRNATLADDLIVVSADIRFPSVAKSNSANLGGAGKLAKI